MLSQVAWFLPGLLMVVTVGLLMSHWSAWQRHQADERDPHELKYRFRQFRRRMQASAMLGIVALGMLVGMAIPPIRFPSTFVFWWAVVIGIVVWVVLLALADIFATHRHIARLKRDRIIADAQLQAELRAAAARRGKDTHG